MGLWDNIVEFAKGGLRTTTDLSYFEPDAAIPKVTPEPPISRLTPPAPTPPAAPPAAAKTTVTKVFDPDAGSPTYVYTEPNAKTGTPGMVTATFPAGQASFPMSPEQWQKSQLGAVGPGTYSHLVETPDVALKGPRIFTYGADGNIYQSDVNGNIINKTPEGAQKPYARGYLVTPDRPDNNRIFSVKDPASNDYLDLTYYSKPTNDLQPGSGENAWDEPFRQAHAAAEEKWNNGETLTPKQRIQLAQLRLLNTQTQEIMRRVDLEKARTTSEIENAGRRTQVEEDRAKIERDRFDFERGNKVKEFNARMADADKRIAEMEAKNKDDAKAKLASNITTAINAKLKLLEPGALMGVDEESRKKMQARAMADIEYYSGELDKVLGNKPNQSPQATKPTEQQLNEMRKKYATKYTPEQIDKFFKDQGWI